MEAAPELGGRAQTRVLDGFCFNQGPHALYLAGALKAALDELGVSAPGGGPLLKDGLALWGEETYPLPVGPGEADIAPSLSAADTRCLAETFGRIGAGDYGGPGRPLRAFTAALPAAVGAVIEALVRNSTYSHAPEEIDAKAALDQLRLGYRGVSYVDGGWRTLVAGLEGAAAAAGAVLRREQPIAALRRERERWLVEAAGVTERFEAVIIAASPEVSRQLVSNSAEVTAAALAAQPVRAMTLDLGLQAVGPGATYALGIDAPVYLSLHSQAAQLAPTGAGLLHLSRFLAPDEAPDAGHFGELERLADRVRPGWRERVAQRQRLVGITVAHDYPRWRRGGRRTPVVVADTPGLFLAGDWVGDDGLLSDASAASATMAAHAAAAFLAGVPAQT